MEKPIMPVNSDNSVTDPRTPNVGRIVIISLVIFIMITVAGTLQLLYGTLTYGSIYKGVSINNIDAGGLTKEEALKLLDAKLQDEIENQELVIAAKDKSVKISYKDIKASYNIEEIVNELYSVGREGNIFKRILAIANAGKYGKQITALPSFDEKAVAKVISQLYDSVYVPVKETAHQITSNEVIITGGIRGEAFDKKELAEQVSARIQKGQGGKLEIPIVYIAPAKIDSKAFQQAIYIDPKDAGYKIDNNVITVIPHIIGRKVDEALAAASIDEVNKKEGIQKSLPIIFTPPALLEDQLNSLLLRDTLYSHTTWYDSDFSNRGTNVRVAAGRIDGKVVDKGQTFSFNETIGTCTEEDGFKIAPTYVGGKVVDDIGGGVCQVSSTLFNSVLYSDLEVVERTNHQFTVGYVPLGQDSAVDINVVDLKFTNTTNWPVKILASAQNGRLTVTLQGTNETPGKTVEIRNDILETYAPNAAEEEDPTLPAGQTRLVFSPQNGYYIKSYKIVRLNGNIVSEGLEYVSRYAPLDKLTRIGTMVVETVEEPAQESTPEKPVQ